MIAKMNKITLVTLSSEREAALEGLRTTGVMHLNFKEGRSPDLDDLLRLRSNVEKAQLLVAESTEGGKPPRENVVEAVDRILRIEEEKRALADELDTIARERERLEPWGDFEPGDLSFIRDKGIPFRLYNLTRADYESVAGRNDVYVIHREKTTVRVVVVGGEIENAVEAQLPEKSLTSIAKRSEEIKRTIEDLNTELGSFGAYQAAMKAKLEELDESIKFERAKLLMNEDEQLSYISGFVPAAKVGAIRDAASKRSWALLVQEPEEDDVVPIMLENKKPIGIISPIFNLLGALPAYHEYDISLWFLIFFSLFFAMIIGDAGYGMIFLGITLFVIFRRKSKGLAAGRELMLFTVLSSATIVWGALSGTWFGYQPIADAVPFRYLVVKPISSFNPRSSETVKYMCFVIGGIQIALAHGWNFITEFRKKPRIRAFGQLGWMAVVFGAFFLVLNLVLDPAKYPMPKYALLSIVAGVCLIVLFSQQEGNFFKGLLKGVTGLFQTFLSSISTFADVISYIRLFAVGLATVEIAKAFNTMASDMGSSVVGLIGSILVLAIGHGINIIMGALSVIVHGVRLNMLEFSSHLGMEWSGIPYDPFSQQTANEPQIEMSKE